VTTVSPGFYRASPGDVLLYESRGFTGWAIRTKTASNVTHTESYLGNGLSAASRNGLGVDTYPFRHEGLLYVMRPLKPFRDDLAAAWHDSVIGQGYDWIALASFFMAGMIASRGKMFCSAHTTRFQRSGGVEPFSLTVDAHKVAPRDFLFSSAYAPVWVHPKERT
jgi:hypothetical protein